MLEVPLQYSVIHYSRASFVENRRQMLLQVRREVAVFSRSCGHLSSSRVGQASQAAAVRFNDSTLCHRMPHWSLCPLAETAVVRHTCGRVLTLTAGDGQQTVRTPPGPRRSADWSPSQGARAAAPFYQSEQSVLESGSASGPSGADRSSPVEHANLEQSGVVHFAVPARVANPGGNGGVGGELYTTNLWQLPPRSRRVSGAHGVFEKDFVYSSFPTRDALMALLASIWARFHHPHTVIWGSACCSSVGQQSVDLSCT